MKPMMEKEATRSYAPDAAADILGTPLYLTRDPDDVLTISSLFKAVWVLLIVLSLSVGINIFLSLRKADRIVVDRSSGRVVELNNRDYGQRKQ